MQGVQEPGCRTIARSKLVRLSSYLLSRPGKFGGRTNRLDSLPLIHVHFSHARSLLLQQIMSKSRQMTSTTSRHPVSRRVWTSMTGCFDPRMKQQLSIVSGLSPDSGHSHARGTGMFFLHDGQRHDFVPGLATGHHKPTSH